jgi:predicted RNase H-like HicB family nuclease
MLPGCITEGDTREQAIAAATEAAQGWLQAAAERGLEIDQEPDGTEAVTVEVAMPISVVAS